MPEVMRDAFIVKVIEAIDGHGKGFSATEFQIEVLHDPAKNPYIKATYKFCADFWLQVNRPTQDGNRNFNYQLEYQPGVCKVHESTQVSGDENLRHAIAHWLDRIEEDLVARAKRGRVQREKMLAEKLEQITDEQLQRAFDRFTHEDLEERLTAVQKSMQEELHRVQTQIDALKKEQEALRKELKDHDHSADAQGLTQKLVELEQSESSLVATKNELSTAVTQVSFLQRMLGGLAPLDFGKMLLLKLVPCYASRRFAGS